MRDRPSADAIDRFCTAARANDVPQLRAMLEDDPRLINAFDGKGWNALAHALGRESVTFLIEQGAEYVEKLIGGAWNDLDWASWRNDNDKVRELLSAGAVQSKIAIQVAASAGNTKAIELILASAGAGADIEFRAPPHQDTRQAGLTPLQFAARQRPRIARELIDLGAQYDIFSAAALDDVSRVSELIEGDPLLVHAHDDYESTPLHWAAQAGRREIVDLLIEKEADVEARNSFDETPLLMATINHYDWATRQSDADVINPILEAGATIDVFSAAAIGDTATLERMLEANPGLVRARNGYGTTALIYAAWNGHMDATRLLLEQGADPSAEDRGGCPGLYYAPYWGRSAETTDLLLEWGARLTFKNIWGRGYDRNDNGGCLDATFYMAQQGGLDIHNAARDGDLKRLRALMSEDAGAFTALTELGVAPIHFAAVADQPDVITLLVDRGVEVDVRVQHPAERFDFTALYLAVHAGATGAAECLLAHGADVLVECKGWGGWTVLHGMASQGGERGDVEGTIDLLVDAGIDINADRGPWGLTALHMAVEQGKPRLVERLLYHGANPNKRNSHEATPLHRLPNPPGRWQAHLTEMLIERGADVNAMNKSGKTPLDMAYVGWYEIPDDVSVEILRKHGAVLGSELS